MGPLSSSVGVRVWMIASGSVGAEHGTGGVGETRDGTGHGLVRAGYATSATGPPCWATISNSDDVSIPKSWWVMGGTTTRSNGATS